MVTLLMPDLCTSLRGLAMLNTTGETDVPQRLSGCRWPPKLDSPFFGNFQPKTVSVLDHQAENSMNDDSGRVPVMGGRPTSHRADGSDRLGWDASAAEIPAPLSFDVEKIRLTLLDDL
jgi:hypothetical protein